MATYTVILKVSEYVQGERATSPLAKKTNKKTNKMEKISFEESRDWTLIKGEDTLDVNYSNRGKELSDCRNTKFYFLGNAVLIILYQYSECLVLR